MEIKQHTFKHTFKEEIIREIRKYLEMNEIESTTYQNLWDTVKVVQRGNCITIHPYIKKQKRSQINNLTLKLKKLEKEEKTEPTATRRKETTKIGAEINEKGNRKAIEKNQ